MDYLVHSQLSHWSKKNPIGIALSDAMEHLDSQHVIELFIYNK